MEPEYEVIIGEDGFAALTRKKPTKEKKELVDEEIAKPKKVSKRRK